MYAMKEDVQAMSYPSYYYDFLAVNLEREPLGERPCARLSPTP